MAVVVVLFCFVLLLFAPEHPKIKNKTSKSLFFQCFFVFSFPLLLFRFLSFCSFCFFISMPFNWKQEKEERERKKEQSKKREE